VKARSFSKNCHLRLRGKIIFIGKGRIFFTSKRNKLEVFFQSYSCRSKLFPYNNFFYKKCSEHTCFLNCDKSVPYLEQDLTLFFSHLNLCFFVLICIKKIGIFIVNGIKCSKHFTKCFILLFSICSYFVNSMYSFTNDASQPFPETGLKSDLQLF